MKGSKEKGLLAELDSYLEVVLTADAKIYVTITVLSIVLIGLFMYLVFTDRKISKVEDELEIVVSNLKDKQSGK